MILTIMLLEVKTIDRVRRGARGNPPRMMVLRCDICGEVYERKYSKPVIDREVHRCSRACWYEERRRNARTKFICKQCGEVSIRRKCDVEQYDFCSRECYGRHRSENPEAYGISREEYQARMNTLEAREKWQVAMEQLQEDWQTGERVHPWVGREHSQATKELISRRHVESGHGVGEKNWMFGRNHTPEAREKMSIAQSKMILNGTRKTYGRNFHKSGALATAKAGEIYYRSSWERAFAAWCDVNDDVLTFTHEPFVIPYWNTENAKRRYIPDFLVEYTSGEKVLYEIKPTAFVNSKAAQLKATAARKHCLENGIDAYEFLTKESLIEMGALNG